MPPADYLRELFNLSGQVAVVIGGTGELCGAMAEGLAGAGAEVVLVGRNAEKASARLARLAALGVSEAGELGGGAVLAGVMKRIAAEVKVTSVGEPASLQALRQALQQAQGQTPGEAVPA